MATERTAPSFAKLVAAGLIAIAIWQVSIATWHRFGWTALLIPVLLLLLLNFANLVKYWIDGCEASTSGRSRMADTTTSGWNSLKVPATTTIGWRSSTEIASLGERGRAASVTRGVPAAKLKYERRTNSDHAVARRVSSCRKRISPARYVFACRFPICHRRND